MLAWARSRPRTDSHPIEPHTIQALPPTPPPPPALDEPSSASHRSPTDLEELHLNEDIWPSIDPQSSSPSWIQELSPSTSIIAGGGLSPLVPARTPKRTKSIPFLAGSDVVGGILTPENSSNEEEEELHFNEDERNGNGEKYRGKRRELSVRREVSATRRTRAETGPPTPVMIRSPKESSGTASVGDASFTFGGGRGEFGAEGNAMSPTTPPFRRAESLSSHSRSDVSPSTYASFTGPPSTPSVSTRMTGEERSIRNDEEVASQFRAESARSVFGLVPRSVAGATRISDGSDTERIPKGGERSFDERSWQFKVAEELYAQSSSRRGTKSSLAVPSLQTRTSSPELSPRKHRSRSGSHSPSSSQLRAQPRHSLTTEGSRVPGSSPRSSVRPSASFSTYPHSTPPSNRGTVPDLETTPESQAPVTSRRESIDSWHDAEEAIPTSQENETKEEAVTLFDVRPSFRAAVTFETTPRSKKRISATSTSLSPDAASKRRASLPSRASQYIDPTPRISASHVVDLSESDPFSDENTGAPPQNSSTPSFIFDDDLTVVLPFPVAPIASTIPSQYLHSPPNFLSGPPKQLRREWKREQRRSLMARSPSPIQLPQRAVSPSLEPRPSIDDSGRPLTPQGEFDQLVFPVVGLGASANRTGPGAPPPSNRTGIRHSPHPSLDSSLNSGWSLPHFMSPLALVPTGAYLFLLGFIFPPCWWIGAFTPRMRVGQKKKDYGSPLRAGPVRLTEVKVDLGVGGRNPFGSDWPGHHGEGEGASGPDFAGLGQGIKRSRLARLLEGTQLWEGGVGWQSNQQSIQTWRRRNRVMSIVSIPCLLIILASGVAPGTAGGSDDADFPALGSGGGGANMTSTGLQQQAAGQSTPSSLLSSYAFQAGTSSLPSAANSFLGNGAMPSSAGGGGVLPAGLNARELSADDFPALSGFNLQAGGGLGGNDSLLGGIGGGGGGANGMSLLGGGGAVGLVRNAAQEQASAVAALQHQQQQNQHRANLLGSMNGQNSSGNPPRAPSAGQGGFFAEGDKRQQAFALKAASINSQQPFLMANSNFGLPNGSSPNQLPPLAPSPGSNVTSSNPPGVLHLQPQRTVGGGPSTTGASPSPSVLSPSQNHSLPPPPSNNSSTTHPSLPPPPTATTTTTSGTVGNPNPQTPAQQVLFSPADRYGLLGLLHIIKESDPDLSMLALGTDLTTLGMDLGATENLYSTFITPWSDSKAALALNIEPDFHLPSCYNVQPPPAGTKIGNFSDETLFFIFYSQPRDAMQEMAAHELYKHNWRYHKELRLWLTKEAGTEPTQKTQSYERGSYIFFDPTLWERVRKDFVLVFDALERKI